MLYSGTLDASRFKYICHKSVENTWQRKLHLLVWEWFRFQATAGTPYDYLSKTVHLWHGLLITRARGWPESAEPRNCWQRGYAEPNFRIKHKVDLERRLAVLLHRTSWKILRSSYIVLLKLHSGQLALLVFNAKSSHAVRWNTTVRHRNK